MTQKELEIAQAACCIGTIWDEYEGTEEFNEMVGKRVQHLIELVRNHLESEQRELDLEEEIKKYCREYYNCNYPDQIQNGNCSPVMPHIVEAARHFYGLRNRALEEAAQHVYESWMGGTMDDVRRDMVELGKVLNARKEETK